MSQCIVDNTVTTVTIQLRSMVKIDLDTIKRLLEQKYEVVKMERTSENHNYV